MDIEKRILYINEAIQDIKKMNSYPLSKDIEKLISRLTKKVSLLQSKQIEYENFN